jgi:hypothetical protein
MGPQPIPYLEDSFGESFPDTDLSLAKLPTDP